MELRDIEDFFGEYIELLDKTGQRMYKNIAEHVKRETIWFCNNVDMLSSEWDCANGLAEKLPECKGKPYVLETLKEAEQHYLSALERYGQIEEIIVTGIGKALDGFRAGKEKCLEKPVPVVKTEKLVRDMMSDLERVYQAVGRGVGYVESVEGLRIEADTRRYKRTGFEYILDDRVDNIVLVDALWSMREMENLIDQTCKAAVEMADEIDYYRPKGYEKTDFFHSYGRHVLKSPILSQHIIHEQARAEGRELISKKPSLRKRLDQIKVAEANAEYSVKPRQRNKEIPR